MLFDSPIFLLFLVIVVAVYWRLPWKAQNYFLLAASYIFYGWWDWRFLLLMAGSTTVDFVIARKIARSEAPQTRRRLLWISLTINFAFLGIFKYFNFFVGSFAGGLSALGVHNVPLPILNVILPPGISFYTFQEVAYIVDVYHRKLEPADSLLDYALFISFFPHLVAGPIQRPGHLLPQVQNSRQFNPEAFYDGLLLILSGLFRKCVIADNCALIANASFNGTLGPRCLPVVLLGVYAFAWEIYGDFSGYSNIARGAAQLMGFHFMVNFRRPYLAETLQDFWRRWHISLSTWLRDYLYIPLGGSAQREVRTYFNLMITMLIGGFWHGANLTFIVWGGIHGSWLAMERGIRRLLKNNKQTDAAPRTHTQLRVWVNRFLIFHLVCLAWIFFRAPSFREALEFLGGMRHFYWRPEFWIATKFLVLFSLPLFLVDLWAESRDEEYLFQKTMPISRVAVAMATLIVVTLFSANEAATFLYFQF